MALDEKYPLALPQGTILAGQYVIEQALGQGGFGITYKAKDHKTGLSVAVKEFFPDSMASRTTQTTVTAFPGERGESFLYGKGCFLQEAETLAEFIGNENIVRVYSYFEENGTAYFVMEFIEGTSFDQYIKEQGGKVSYEEAERILLPVIDALALVHAKGIVHRDVTPDNIYITKDGRVKLLDFGAARYSLGDKSRSLDVVLKHGFAPKEQYTRRGRQGPYTDVYTVGASFYFAITGRRPPDSIDRMDEDELIPPSSLGVRIAPGKEDAILTAMNVQPSNRYQTMGEFRQALMGAQNAAQPSQLPQTQQGMTQAQEAAAQPVQQRVFTAPQPTPVPQRAPVPQPAPVPQRAPVPQPTPVPQQVPMPQPIPVSQQASVPQRAPVPQPTPVPQQAPMPQPTPVPQQAPVPQRAPVPPSSYTPQQTHIGQQSAPIPSPSQSIQQSMQPQSMGQQSIPQPPHMKEKKKKKWILPAGIGVGAALVVILVIAVVSSGGDTKEKPAHYEIEEDPIITSNPNTDTETEKTNEDTVTVSHNLLKGNTSDNISEYGQMAVYNGDVYMCYPGGNGLLKVSDSGVEWLEEGGYIRCLNVVDDTVYYINTGQVYSMSTDGRGKAPLPELGDVSTIATLWVTDSGYYYYKNGSGLIYVEKDSANSKGYIECAGGCNGVSFLGENIYYLKESDAGSALYRAKGGNLNGTPEKLIGEGEIASCDRIASDGEYVYGLYFTEKGKMANIFLYDVNEDDIVNTYQFDSDGGWNWGEESITSMNVCDGYVYFVVQPSGSARDDYNSRVYRFYADENEMSVDVPLVYEMNKGERIEYLTVLEDVEEVILTGWMSGGSDYYHMLAIISPDGSEEPIIFKDTDLEE